VLATPRRSDLRPCWKPAHFGSGIGSRNTAGPAIDTPLGVSLMRQTAVNRPDVPLPFVRDLQKRQSPGMTCLVVVSMKEGSMSSGGL